MESKSEAAVLENAQRSTSNAQRSMAEGIVLLLVIVIECSRDGLCVGCSIVKSLNV
jgi:hypothetical protein